MTDHAITVRSDEYFCTRCHRLWARDEEPPVECVSEPAVVSAPPQMRVKAPVKKKKFTPLPPKRRRGISRWGFE